MKKEIFRLKERLETEGYFCYSIEKFQNELIVSQDLGEHTQLDIKNLKALCRVKSNAGEFTLFQIKGSFIEQTPFRLESEVIRFIKKQFPI